MARSVNNINVSTLVVHRTVFGKDGDATLFFKVIGVHYALGHRLILAKGTRMLKQLVNQGGLAVVNVGNNGNVSELSHQTPFLFMRVRRDKSHRL